MVKYPNKFGYSLVYSYLCTRNRLGNGVRIPDCPAAVSSHSRCEHDVTDIIGKTFADPAASQNTCLLHHSSSVPLGLGP